MKFAPSSVFKITRFHSLFLLALTICFVASSAFGQATNAPASAEGHPGLKDTVLLIIRHAEKTTNGDLLSPEGYKRADAYVNYFKNYQVNGQPLKLDYIYAAADSKASKRVRLTVEPLSKATGLKIDNRFANKDFQGMVDELEKQGRGHEVLICWHHGQIANLLKALDADPDKLIPTPKWPEDVYYWMMELHYDSNGRLIAAQTKRVNENLMPGDAAAAAALAKSK